MKIFKYQYDRLFNPLLAALDNLGGSGSVSELEEEVAQILQLSEDEINDMHQGNRSKFSYRLAWARSYLKNYGLLDNSLRGVWVLTNKGKKTKVVDPEKVKKSYAIKTKNMTSSAVGRDSAKMTSSDLPVDIIELDWQNQLISTIKQIKPEQFERLCQRFLRELGFVNVEVTKQSADGGIDGQGIYKLGSVLSFHVVFQSKRYDGSVSSNVIRDFRGAMSGRADKGLIITTGNFTRDAKREAVRDGAVPIDLIDGNEFAEKLKELGLGVSIALVEEITIKTDFFNKI